MFSHTLDRATSHLSAHPSSFSLRRAIFAAVVALGIGATSATAVPTLYTIGDSTVQIWASGYYPKAGWGQVLPKFFDSTKVNVVDKAVGGTSAKSFYDTYWSGVKSLIVPGDYVFVQFGINDAATDTARHTDPFTTFEDYLRDYINETKARGGIPVIVATLRRNAWNTDGTVYDAYHNYPIAARDVAAQMNVPCIDLDGMCKTLMESLGQTYTTYFWYMHLASGEWPNYPSGQSDDVHFQESGALEMARLVVQGIRQSSFTSMQNLVPALRPTATVSFSSNNPSGGMITRTQAFPQGVTVTAMARPNSGVSFLSWSGSFSSTKRIAQFTMGTAAMSITANFSGGGTADTYQAETAALGGGAVTESTNAGYMGTGYVNFPSTGGTLTFNSVDGNGGGTKALAIRYANGTTASRTGTITVNGVTTNITFNPTGAWTTWATLNVNITLTNSTTNTIKFASTGQDLANIDQITVP